MLDEMQTRFGSPQDPVTFELVYVDDGSTDATLPELKRIAGQARPDGMDVRYLSFSRNFGKEAALLAGLDAAHGEYVATMDADMQDPPSLLPTMYEMLLASDADNVATRRVTRKGEPPIRSFFARMFYRIINRLSDTCLLYTSRGV